MLLLNLLPKNYILRFKKDVWLRVIYTATVFIVFWSVILGIIILSAYQYLVLENLSTKERTRLVQSMRDTAQAQQLEATINEVNALAIRIDHIRKIQPYEFSDLLEQIAPMLPAGSNLTRLTFVASSNQIILEGHSDLRTYVLTLQERLESSRLFRNIEAPLSNLLKAQDVNFKFTIQLIREG